MLDPYITNKVNYFALDATGADASTGADATGVDATGADASTGATGPATGADASVADAAVFAEFSLCEHAFTINNAVPATNNANNFFIIMNPSKIKSHDLIY